MIAKLGFHGTYAQAAHIPDRSTSNTVDAEARAAIEAILVALEGKGLVAGGWPRSTASRSLIMPVRGKTARDHLSTVRPLVFSCRQRNPPDRKRAELPPGYRTCR